MSLCSTRPRAYSKPTREELKELNTYLAQRSAEELRSVIHLAATQSSETAHILLKVLSVLANSPFQPVQAHTQTDIPPHTQQHRELEHFSTHDGLLTPADSEDSEMSGTENIPPPPPPPPTHSGPSLSLFNLGIPGSQAQAQSQGNTKSPLSPVQERRLKRKSLAEWDDNTAPSPLARHATTPFQPHHSPSTKRRRAAPHGLKVQHQQQQQVHRQVSSCLNCGKEYSYSSSQHAGSVHGCMYHPGVLQSDHKASDESSLSTRETALKSGKWDCCRGGSSSPGCLVTQHRDVNVDGYRTSMHAYSSLGIQASWDTREICGSGPGLRSMFAELVARKVFG